MSIKTKIKTCLRENWAARRKSGFWVVILIIQIQSSQEAWATDRVELSLGSAAPSANDAIQLNPAALAKDSERVFDFGILTNSFSNASVQGSLAGGGGGLGYGLEVQQLGSGLVPTVALAVGNGKFSLGINATSTLNNFSPIFGLGISQELGGILLGLVFNNLNNFGRDWTAGFATQGSSFIRGGLDFHFQNFSSGFGISNATTTATIGLYAEQKFSLKLSYGVEIVPTLNSTDPGFNAGLNIWIGPKISLYALYLANDYNYTFGLKYFF